AVVQEALRLGTPLGNLARSVPPEGSVICSRFIRAGTTVGCICTGNQRENFWPEPIQFKPQRWLTGGAWSRKCTEQISSHLVFHFLVGLFSCLGRTLAVKELYIVTAQLLLPLDIQFDPSFDHDMFKVGICQHNGSSGYYTTEVIERQGRIQVVVGLMRRRGQLESRQG
ncbi:cytochrome P450, partial [Mycena epipterygia]